jgi:hypothetical protein
MSANRAKLSDQVKALQLSTGIKKIKDSIGGSNRSDIWNFSLKNRASLNIGLHRSQSSVDVQLFNGRTRLVPIIEQQTKQAKVLRQTLEPGTYSLQVVAHSRKSAPYRLNVSADQTAQYYTFTYSYGNGDRYTGYGYSNLKTYASGQKIFDNVANETGFTGFYSITSVIDKPGEIKNINQVVVDRYYDSERNATYTPAAGSGSKGLGSELGYLARGDRSTYFQAHRQEADLPVLLGVYSADFLGDQAVIDSQLNKLGALSGQSLSMGGLFVDLEDSNPAYNVGVALDRLRQNGYTAFMNLTSSRSLTDIANGKTDDSIKKLAKAYAQWTAKDKNHIAYIAPLPEMNGTWESYSGTPQAFKLAYSRIQQIFAEAGVPDGSVRWVFAPNGWSPDDRKFEQFYPGADAIDVIAFSAYNWGFAQSNTAQPWQTPTEVFEPYLNRIRRMAPEKPIFISQTGTTSMTQTGSDLTAKNRWLRDAYGYLSTAPGVRGVLYFNLNKETDWSLWQQSGGLATGYQEAVRSPAFEYIAPDELAQSQLFPNL